VEIKEVLLVFHGKGPGSRESVLINGRYEAVEHGIPFPVRAANADTIIKNDSRISYYTDKSIENLQTVDKKIPHSNRKSVIFLTGPHIGDNLLARPAVFKYVLIHPGTDIIVAAKKEIDFIWKDNPRIKFWDFDKEFTDDMKNYQKFVIGRKLSSLTLDRTHLRAQNISDEILGMARISLDECRNFVPFEKTRIEKLARKRKLLVAVQLGSQDNRRSWDITNGKLKAELVCKELISAGYIPVLLHKEELNLNWSINWRSCVNYTGKTNVKQLFNVIAHCKFCVILGDSSGEHIAGHLGVPFFAMFRTDICLAKARIAHYENYGYIECKRYEDVAVESVLEGIKETINKYMGDE